jgi:myosin protein heavy chain
MSGRAVSSGRILKLVGFAAVSVCILVFLVVQNNLRSQLSETQEKLHEIERDNQDLQLKLRDAHDARSLMEAEKTKVFRDLDQVKSEHGKAVSAMQNELNEMKAKHSRALSDSEESIKEAKDGQSQCEDQKQQMELQNSKHVSILSADLQEEKYKMNECNKSKITVEQRLSQLQANVKANKAKFDNMQKALEDYNSEEASLKERLSAVDKELASLKEQLKSCKESLQARVLYILIQLVMYCIYCSMFHRCTVFPKWFFLG